VGHRELEKRLGESGDLWQCKEIGSMEKASQSTGCRFHQIATIVSSTSRATDSSCSALNKASRVVGFKVARNVLPSSS